MKNLALIITILLYLGSASFIFSSSPNSFNWGGGLSFLGMIVMFYYIHLNYKEQERDAHKDKQV